MKLQRYAGCYALGIVLILLLLANLSTADGPPAMHWGSMELSTNWGNCLGRTKKAFLEAGVRHTQKTGWQTYGQKDNASVLVSCTPKTIASTYLLVTATSNDSKAAELLRNEVRARIARTGELD
jgi:hypothetical protein